jgi:hypothetical protein
MVRVLKLMKLRSVQTVIQMILRRIYTKGSEK